MRHKIDPRQTRLFDPFEPVFSESAYRRVLGGWYGVMRSVILSLLPVDTIEQSFHPTMGRPTKELYSMAGLVFAMEFMDWTEEEALEAYVFNNAVQFALNLEPAKQALGERTLRRYVKLFRENDLAKKVMDEVTVRLVETLEINVEKQRLDSSHVFSDMAAFGRTKVMGTAMKRFLTQVKRHNREVYLTLPEQLRERYQPSVQKLFGDVGKGERSALRQQVAEDLLYLIERFADEEQFATRQTYRLLVRVFEDQCEIKDAHVVVRKKTGGDVIQNTSDPDATYDGHKGPGYQVQVSETCSADNEVQLITSALVQTAVEHDQGALEPMLDNMEERGLLPESMLADTHYGSDENVVLADARGVDLQSPVSPGGRSNEDPFELGIDDFVVEPETETVRRCPAGHEPISSEHDPATGTTTTIMPNKACAGCEFGAECPVRRLRGGFVVVHTPKQRRLEERRREQATKAFRENYRLRAGGESVFSGLKRKTGLGRLRVRKLRAVKHKALLKIAGWNLLRAAASSKMKQIVLELARELGYAPTILGRSLAPLASCLSKGAVCTAIGRPSGAPIDSLPLSRARTAGLPSHHPSALSLAVAA